MASVLAVVDAVLAETRDDRARPEWTMDFIEGLQSDVAAIDQASTQCTLALIFDVLVDFLSSAQHARAVEIMQTNLAHHFRLDCAQQHDEGAW